ncbi:short chain dehydrogenase [bacterium]|nr:short chain dehydrogenase [bacterium]
MRILIIGGYGTVGGTATKALSERHEVIVAGRTRGDVQVDIADIDSIRAMYDAVPNLDAVVCAAGAVKWDTFDNLQQDDFYVGFRSKLMGQVNLVRVGQDRLNDGGSFTLTTGILGERPVPMTTSAAMVNGAIHSFVKAVTLEIRRNLRVNVVAPGLLEDSAPKLGKFFPGQTPVAMDKVGAAYASAVEGTMTGELIRVYE